MDALQGYGDSSGDESGAEEESIQTPTTSTGAASSATFSIPTIPAVDSLEAEVGRKEWETREAPAKPVGKGKKKVLITLPSLGNLDSDDEEESAAKKKPRPAQGCAAAPSATKSRLLSMLPAPSTGPTTTISLPKPLTTHKRLETPKTAASPAASASTATTTSLLPASLRAKAKKEKEKKKSGSAQEEAEETVLPADFFGSGPSEQPEIGLPPPTVPFQPLEGEVVDDEYALPAEVEFLETPAAMTAPLNTAAEVHPSQAYNCANVAGSSSATGSVQGYSDEAAQRLIYRNESEAWGQLRPQGGGNVEIRDVSVADELGPNVRENLLRNLAYRPGQPQQPPSMSDVPGKRKRQKQEDEPSQLARRKHQITFLAHQAKAREEALQQQWALNRASRTQSRNKYGF